MYVRHLIRDVVLQLHLEGRKGWINTGDQQVWEGLGCEDSGVSVCLVKPTYGQDYCSDVHKFPVNLRNVYLVIVSDITKLNTVFRLC